MPFLELTLELQGWRRKRPKTPRSNLARCRSRCTDGRDDAVLEPAPGEVRLWPATRMQALFPRRD